MNARLPIKDPLLALALHTAGFPSVPELTHHIDEGKSHLTYWIDGEAHQANALIMTMADPDPAKNLQRTTPAHPLLACRHAIEAYGILAPWLDGRPMSPPAMVRTSGPLCRVVPHATADYDLLQHVWSGLTPAIRVSDARFAAALIVCGFPYYPVLLPPGHGQPAGLAFPAESLTFPGLTHALLAAHVTTPLQAAPLPGFLIGEHPFDYAYQAAVNAACHPLFLRQADRNPQIFLKGPGTGGIIASQSLFDASRKDSSFRDAAHAFLSGG